MVDLTGEERAAIAATMKRVALLMDEIGWQAALADLTEAQVRAVIEEASPRQAGRATTYRWAISRAALWPDPPFKQPIK